MLTSSTFTLNFWTSSSSNSQVKINFTQYFPIFYIFLFKRSFVFSFFLFFFLSTNFKICLQLSTSSFGLFFFFLDFFHFLLIFMLFLVQSSNYYFQNMLQSSSCIWLVSHLISILSLSFNLCNPQVEFNFINILTYTSSELFLVFFSGLHRIFFRQSFVDFYILVIHRQFKINFTNILPTSYSCLSFSSTSSCLSFSSTSSLFSSCIRRINIYLRPFLAGSSYL